MIILKHWKCAKGIKKSEFTKCNRTKICKVVLSSLCGHIFTSCQGIKHVLGMFTVNKRVRIVTPKSPNTTVGDYNPVSRSKRTALPENKLPISSIAELPVVVAVNQTLREQITCVNCSIGYYALLKQKSYYYAS